jgi:hypothetical protein
MRKLRTLVLFPLLLSLAVNGNAQSPTTLQATTPIERSLGPGRTHEFTVNLEANSYLQLVVEQRGIDVIVKVFSPGNKSLGEYDSPNGDNGPEPVSFVGVAAGIYSIRVNPLAPADAATGRYQIKIVEMRQATEQELKASQNLEVAKAKGLALLQELDGPISEIKSAPTRIRFQLQAAQMLWDADEKRASKYLSDAATGMKELVASIDVDSQQYLQQFSAMAQLRQDIVQALAEHDPDAALSFLYATVPKSNPFGNEREQSSQERSVELSVVNAVLRKDPKRALQMARKNLKAGFSSQIIGTLAQLQRQSPELANEFEAEIAAKIKTEKLLKDLEAANVAIALLESAGQSGRYPSFSATVLTTRTSGLSEAQYKELWEKVLIEALSYSPTPAQPYNSERDAAYNLLAALQAMGQGLDAVTTAGSAEAVKRKMAELMGPGNQQQALSQKYQAAVANAPPEAALGSIEKAPAEIREQLYIQLAGRESNSGDASGAKQIVNEHVTSAYQRSQALQNIAQQEVYLAMSKGKVDEALRILNGLPAARERASLLAQIAHQIGPGQKRAAAINLLEQARALLSPSIQAADQEQMNALFEIARAFSGYDSKRSFEILDPLIDQFNEICTAARTLQGFGMEYFEDDELSMQNGNSVTYIAGQMTGVLGTLALTNFERAKAASDRIQLPEVRLKAYLDLAQKTIQREK